MKLYTNHDKARKAAGKRSLFASLNGKFTQYEVREINGQFYAGMTCDTFNAMGGRIVDQYADGYHVNDYEV